MPSIDIDLVNNIKNNSFTDQKLSLLDMDLTDQDLEPLVEALKFNAHIKELDLSLNHISDEGAKKLATLSNIEAMNLGANNIGTDGTLALARSNLKWLDISGNHIGDAVAAFATSTLLMELVASQCAITDRGAESLYSSKTIKKLDIGSNDIQGESLRALTDNHSLEELRLDQNPLSHQCCGYFADNSTLVTLYLTNTFVGDAGVALLAKNNHLQHVILIQCGIGDAGAIELSQNKHLKKVVLYNNHIGNDGAVALANNNNFLFLDLSCNRFDAASDTVLRQRYNGYDHVLGAFTRNEEFLEHLKKSEASRQQITHDNALLLTPGFGLLAQHSETLSPPEPISVDTIVDFITTDPRYVEFFDFATPDTNRLFIRKLEANLVARTKKTHRTEDSPTTNGSSNMRKKFTR